MDPVILVFAWFDYSPSGSPLGRGVREHVQASKNAGGEMTTWDPCIGCTGRAQGPSGLPSIA